MIETKQLHEKAYEISDDPRKFNWEKIAEIVGNIATKILNNEKLNSDDYCECSRFDLENQIKIALEGDLILDLQLIYKHSNKVYNSEDDIRLFRREFCEYLWRIICENWEQNQETPFKETQYSVANEVDALMAA